MSSTSSSSSSSSSSSFSCHSFTLDEIKEATNNFDEEMVIGHGGEGKVYLANIYLYQKNEKTLVAVKQLKPNSSEFEKEIQTISKIHHPNLVSLLGYCQESGQKILVYEYMQKGSLSNYVKNKIGTTNYLPWKLRLNICIGAARGLQHMHTPTEELPKGIIHRDIKPANILLDESWVAKVSDFGLFKLSHAGQTQSGVITDLKGTSGYYAPENFMHNQISRKIDVYALGVVMFEVLCRKSPWDRGEESYFIDEEDDLGLWARENVDTEIKEEISEDSLVAFTEIIRKCLQQNPTKRPTMDEMVMDLESALKCQEHRDELINPMSPRPYDCCGDTPAHCGPDCHPTPPTPGDLIPRWMFDRMLLHRNDVACPGKGFYTYDAFIAAVNAFRGFATTGDNTVCKREIAAFLAQTSHETTGGWASAPDGPYSWGYCYIREQGYPPDYCVPNAQWPCAPGRKYYGRGPIQISYNFNYGLAGEAIGVDLLKNPDLVATDAVISFKTAIWFWMTPQSPKPSCHAVITGGWTPSEADSAAGRNVGFGTITNIISGGVECGHGSDARVNDRIGFYKRYCDILGVSYGDNLDCANQRPFG